MSEISEIEIKSMTKEQNYMRGYGDGKSDVLEKIRAEIRELKHFPACSEDELFYNAGLLDAIEIIDKHKAERGINV